LSTWSLFHDPSPLYAGLSDGVATLRLRARQDAPILGVLLRTAPEGEQVLTPAAPAPAPATHAKHSRWWEVQVPVHTPRLHYRWFLRTENGGWWYNASGLHRFAPTDYHDFQLLPGYRPVAWVNTCVFYQVFPERFASSDAALSVKDGEYELDGRPVVARKWTDIPQPETGTREFFGGDLPGLVAHLDHLEMLGVNALYLNPVFTAPSNHKYDVADYYRVDPHFGGDAALATLREELNRRGMRLVLDIVPNHCGATNAWFLDAQADPQAPTAEYFTFRQHPHDYECWLGVRSLPKLNYRSHALREQMYAGEDSVMRHWLRAPYALDGWRIDVANMLARQGDSQLAHKIGRGIRRAVKYENPEAYLLGENFFDGTRHLQGEELDATMNYRGFMMPLLHWLGASPEPDHEAPLPTQALLEQWTAFRAPVPWVIALQQLNLVGSHDTPRLLTLVRGDRALAWAAMVCLFTYPGVPSVYYGDEIGLTGGRDPENRAPMPWDEDRWDKNWLACWRALIGLRRQSAALAWGSFEPVLAGQDTLAYLREVPGERVLVVLKRAPEPTGIPLRQAGIADRTRWVDLYGQEQLVGGGSLIGSDASGQIWREVTS